MNNTGTEIERYVHATTQARAERADLRDITLAERNHMISSPRFPIRPTAAHGMLYVPNAKREEER